MLISDEDLLLAAKAAGITPGTMTLHNIVTCLWNPVDKDVDSFRLMLALRKYGLEILITENGCNVSVAAFRDCDTLELFEDCEIFAAARLAIFRVAVAIGRAIS